MKERAERMLIDFGANLVPGFVGGSGDMASCVERIKDLHSFGVAAAVLTPRYYPSKMTTAEFTDRRKRILEKLYAELPVKRPALYVGSEVYVDERLKYIHDVESLAIQGTHTVITVMPNGVWEDALLDTLISIRNAGYEVLVSHVDSIPLQYAQALFRLEFKGIADASVFSGLTNIKKRKQVLSWIDNGNIVALGSNFTADDQNKHFKTERIRTVIGNERSEKLAVKGAQLLAGAYPYPDYLY